MPEPCAVGVSWRFVTVAQDCDYGKWDDDLVDLPSAGAEEPSITV